MVGKPRHITQHQGVGLGASNHADMVFHLVHRHGHGGIATLHHHAEAVADQQDVYIGAVDQTRERTIVRGDHRQTMWGTLGFTDTGNGNLCTHLNLISRAEGK